MLFSEKYPLFCDVACFRKWKLDSCLHSYFSIFQTSLCIFPKILDSFMSVAEVQGDDSWNMHLFPCNKIANNLPVRKPQQEPPFSGNIYKPHNQITMKIDCHGSTVKCIEKINSKWNLTFTNSYFDLLGKWMTFSIHIRYS